MIVILFDSEGQIYTEIVGSPQLLPKMHKLSTWMEAFNDIHYEGPDAEEIPK
jgi:hypothetical protein